MTKIAREDKMTAQLLIMLPDELLDALRETARKNTVSAAELLRRAARAIVDCQRQFNSVPLDMEIVQRRHDSVDYTRGISAVLPEAERQRFDTSVNDTAAGYDAGAKSTAAPAPQKRQSRPTPPVQQPRAAS